MAKETWQAKISRLCAYLEQTPLEAGAGQWPKTKLLRFKFARFIYILAKEGDDDSVLLRASALTYVTLLSLVPLLALSLALLTAFSIPQRFLPTLIGKIAPTAPELGAKILQALGEVNVATLGAVGVITLILTAIGMLRNIEAAFNVIWDSKRGRSWFRAFSDYLSLLVVSPVVLVVVLGFTGIIEARSAMWFQKLTEISVFGRGFYYLLHFFPYVFGLLPYVLLTLFFTFIYFFLPYAKVRFPAALVGGLIAGPVWQLTQWAYVRFQVGVAKYNAIYGSMAQLPLLLVWIYVSWVILLLGAEISFVWQNLNTYSPGTSSRDLSLTARERLALELLCLIHGRFYEGKEPMGSEELAQKAAVPQNLADDILNCLVEAGMIVENEHNGCQSYLPAKDLSRLEVASALASFRNLGKHDLSPSRFESPTPLNRYWKNYESAVKNGLGSITFSDLLKERKD